MAIDFSKYGSIIDPSQIKSGKTEDKFRNPITTIKEAAKSGVSQMGEAIKESQAGRNPLETGAKFAAGAIGTVFSPIAPLTQPIGEGIEQVSSKIADIPAVQKFAMTKAGERISRGAELTANLSTVAGTAAGFAGGKPIVNKMKSTYQDIKNTPPAPPGPGGGGSGGMINKAQDYLANKQIDPRTQTILKEVTPEKLDRYVKSGKESMVDPRKLTSIEEAAQTAQRVNSIIKEDMGKIGAQKSASLSSVGGAKVPGIATKQLEAIKPLLQKKLTVSERKLVNDYVKELKALGEKPTAQSVDSTIDKLQATLFERKGGTAIPVSPRIQSFINQSIRALNDDLKRVVDKTLGGNEYSALNSAYAKKAQIFRVLNKALGEGGTRGGSLFNRFFSTADSSVKRLFEIIKQEYGVDLAQDATIARFVMETLGDTRIKPYLNLPLTSTRGIIEKVAEYAQETLTSPERIFETARAKTTPITSLNESLKNQ